MLKNKSTIRYIHMGDGEQIKVEMTHQTDQGALPHEDFVERELTADEYYIATDELASKHCLIKSPLIS